MQTRLPASTGLGSRRCGLPAHTRAVPHVGQVHRRRALTPCVAALPLDADSVTYIGLGVTSALFATTFFIIPRFKSAFKEPIAWKTMYPTLVDSGLRTVSPTEAAALAKRGAVLLDVRPANARTETSWPTGSLSVPLYLPIRKWDIPSNIRRAGFAFFGIFGTELNEDFGAEAQALLARGNKEIIVMCGTGGSLTKKTGVTDGFQSRSLKAAYYLQQAGFKTAKLYHMEGGVIEWQREGLPMTSEDE